MIVAVIDIGTNTFNLLIRDVKSDELFFKNKISVRLGEAGLSKNELHPNAIQRGIDALKEHKKTIEKYGVKEIYAFATSAVRSTSNGGRFVELAWKETQIRINVIDGDDEAQLIYHGVKQAIEFEDSYYLIMDVGGGSTEFIIANKDGLVWKKSYALGVSRLIQKFNPSDPILPAEVHCIEEYLNEELEDLLNICQKYPIKDLIGSSGSFDTLASMIVNENSAPDFLADKNQYDFKMGDYYAIAKNMLGFNYEQRLHTPGMIPMRADLIVLACVLVSYILEKLKIKNLQLSTFALKEGVFKLLNNESIPWQKS